MTQWQWDALASLALASAGLLGRPLRRRWLVVAAAGARECALVLGLFALWQVARMLAITRVAGAMAHGQSLWRLERAVHLPSEIAVQHAALAHPLFVQACNHYYAYAHFPAMNAFLIWLFWRHRDRYPAARNAMVALTGACLLIQLVPVAPPRLLGGLGFVDTGLRYGQSVYGSATNAVADQFSAMPSVHVGWAVLIAVVTIRAGRSRWRLLVLPHPVATIVVVVVTANHFWLDGVVAVGLLAGALLVAPAGAARAAPNPVASIPTHGVPLGTRIRPGVPVRRPGVPTVPRTASRALGRRVTLLLYQSTPLYFFSQQRARDNALAAVHRNLVRGPAAPGNEVRPS